MNKRTQQHKETPPNSNITTYLHYLIKKVILHNNMRNLGVSFLVRPILFRSRGGVCRAQKGGYAVYPRRRPRSLLFDLFCSGEKRMAARTDDYCRRLFPLASCRFCHPRPARLWGGTLYILCGIEDHFVVDVQERSILYGSPLQFFYNIPHTQLFSSVCSGAR